MKKPAFVFPFVLLFALTLFAEQFPVKEAVEPFVGESIAGAVTVVADKDKVLQLDVFGYANLEDRVPMSADTPIWIASQSKPITAVAVMMLVEEGKLGLDNPITDYLPELAELRVGVKQDNGNILLVPVEKPITLRLLLSHKSGMEWVPPLQQKHGIDVLPFSKAITACVMTPLKSQPGTEHSYSNMSINIAATAVERVTEMLFEDFLQKRLFDPLGMKDTTFWPTPEQMKKTAVIYQKDKASGKLVAVPNNQLTYPLEDRKIRFPEAAGGLFSTPNDLVKFYQMLLGQGEFHGVRFLKPESVAEISKKQLGFPHDYGLGTAVKDGVFGHAGACGTDSKVDTNLNLTYLWFVQQQGIPEANKAKDAFFKAVRETATKK